MKDPKEANRLGTQGLRDKRIKDNGVKITLSVPPWIKNLKEKEKSANVAVTNTVQSNKFKHVG
tara:strand:+ start:2297 stop:2485 length:189 start_codon:yes stop_codon:yes gene_type:complete